LAPTIIQSLKVLALSNRGVDEGVRYFDCDLDETTPFVPQFSSDVAAILNGLASSSSSRAGRSFRHSPFLFAEKAAFPNHGQHRTAETTGRGLPFVASSVTRGSCVDPDTLTDGRSDCMAPVNYQGVADGRNEFRAI
jgi:hypothetical protein